MQELWLALTEMAWLEAAGLASGILCVWLLIRENVWTFPIGLLYAAISVVVFARTRLYGDVALSMYYVAMNAYGWVYWVSRGERTSTDDLAVTRMPARWYPVAVVVLVLCTFGIGWLLANRTDANFAYWNAATTSGSLLAMWMTARKYIENWWLWLAVDVVAVGVYIASGILLYALLYLLYLGMAVWGYRSWRHSLRAHASSA